MKITPCDYSRLKSLLLETVNNQDIKPISSYEMGSISYIWDIYHFTLDNMQINNRINDYLFLRNLYSYLDDNTLNTALKRILITERR